MPFLAYVATIAGAARLIELALLVPEVAPVVPHFAVRLGACCGRKRGGGHQRHDDPFTHDRFSSFGGAPPEPTATPCTLFAEAR
jgi:hypothetical protein